MGTSLSRITWHRQRAPPGEERQADDVRAVNQLLTQVGEPLDVGNAGEVLAAPQVAHRHVTASGLLWRHEASGYLPLASQVVSGKHSGGSHDHIGIDVSEDTVTSEEVELPVLHTGVCCRLLFGIRRHPHAAATAPVPHERVSPTPRSCTRIEMWSSPCDTTNSTLTPSGYTSCGVTSGGVERLPASRKSAMNATACGFGTQTGTASHCR